MRVDPLSAGKKSCPNGHRAISSAVCPGCHSTNPRLLGHKNGYKLIQCQGCGNISARLLADQSLRDQIYEHYYQEASFHIPEATAASLDRLVVSFQAFRCTGRLIDVGFGEGGLLNAAERHGWSCYGAEVDFRALEYGRRRGWTVTEEAGRDERFPRQGFDIVTMIEFLEHVPDPGRFLSAALQWLRPGGVLYLTTPNAQSLNHRLLGLDWSIYCPPDHITIWTAAGLRSALSNAGFTCRRIRTEGLNPGEVVARLTSKTGDRVTINRQQVAVNLNSAFSRGPFQRALKRGVNRFLSAFRAGDGIKVWATPAGPSHPTRMTEDPV